MKKLLLLSLVLLTMLLAACGKQTPTATEYTIDDLYALGFTEQDILYLGATNKSLVECPASDLQSFVRVASALLSGDAAPDITLNDFINTYRQIEIFGSWPEGQAAVTTAAEIGGKAYVLREDGSVCLMDGGDYRFMLELCSVNLPYPEDIDTSELFPVIKAAVAGLPGDLVLPETDFVLGEVKTTSDFVLKDSPPYYFSDIEPPEGQYVAIVPCGNYYELQIGVNKTDKGWSVGEIKPARAYLGTMTAHDNGQWNFIYYGYSFTDVDVWGTSQTRRAELYDINTGEVLWRAENLCMVGPAHNMWSEDGRYAAISTEVGRKENLSVHTIILDTSTMTDITLTPPGGIAGARLEMIEWTSENKLILGYTVKDQISNTLIYDVNTGETFFAD